VLELGLTIAAKFTITIVIDSQKYYHDRLSISWLHYCDPITIISIVYILYIFNQLIFLIPFINRHIMKMLLFLLL